MTEAKTSKSFLNAVVDPKDANIDIVAVHGLNPTNEDFHAYETWTAAKKLWLRDFLPKKQPKARVLLFGYNSNVAFETSTAGVREQAINLLNRLRAKREDAPERPIMFVAHSLGGIIVKRALVEAKLDDTYASIRSATYGIAFFGTPHRGGNLAKLGDIAARIARGILLNPGNTFMESLKKDSLFSDGLAEDFRHLLEDYYVLSFFETLPTKKLGLIVDKKSATLGLSGTREKQIAMDANHTNLCKFDDIEGADYEQVVENLVELVNSATKAFSERQRLAGLSSLPGEIPSHLSGPAFIVPYSSNPDFVGREDIIQKLEEKLAINGEYQPRAAIYGLGGVGKSQIAIKHAYLVRLNHPDVSVFWIHGCNFDQFYSSYLKIAQECHIPGFSEAEIDKLALVRDWLQSPSCGKWLMIIDNADDAEIFFKPTKETDEGAEPVAQDAGITMLASYIPDRLNGSILVTTRDKRAGSYFVEGRGADLIEAKKMDEMESIALMNTRLGRTMTQEAELRELTERLEHLPLALVQAAAFIQQNSLSVSAYLKLYKSSDDTETELLSRPFPRMGDSNVANAVTTTWMISFEQIRRKNPRAAELLSLMTFMDRHRIPGVILQMEDESDVNLIEAFGVLKAFSLITQDEDEDMFDIHRLVQLVMRKWLILRKEAENWVGKTLEIISTIYPYGQYETWLYCAIISPHARAILEHEITSEQEKVLQAKLLVKLAWFLTSQAFFAQSETLSLRAIDMRRAVFGEEHIDTLSSRGNLSTTYWRQGRLKEAEELALQVATTVRRVYGDEYPETLQSASILVLIYRSQGRWEEAEKLQVQTLECMKRVYGEMHPDTLRCIVNLAAIFGTQGRFNHAEELLVGVLKSMKEVLGEKHPDTLSCAMNLGLIYFELGRLKKAESLQVQTMGRMEEVLGDESLQTIASMGNVAEIYREQGRWKDAENLQIRVKETRLKVLGPKHPDTLRSMTNLAANYSGQGQSTEAEEIYVKVIEMRKSEFGEEHPDTLVGIMHLSAIYANQGKWKEAEELKLQVIEKMQRAIGEKHPDTLRAILGLVRTYVDQGRWENAEKVGLKLLESLRDELGKSNILTMDSMRVLASVYRHQNRWEEAENVCMQAVELMKEEFCEEHPDILSVWSEMASIYIGQKRWEEAEQLLLWLTGVMKQTMGDENHETLNSLERLAKLYGVRKRVEEAEQLILQVLEVRSRVLGPEHPDTLRGYYNLVIVYSHQHRFRAALGLGSGMLEVMKRAYGENHPLTLQHTTNLVYIRRMVWFSFFANIFVLILALIFLYYFFFFTYRFVKRLPIAGLGDLSRPLFQTLWRT